MCVSAGARWFQSASILGIFRPFQVDDTFNKHTVTWTQTPSQSKAGCLWDLLFGSRAGALLVGLVIFAVLQFLVGPIGLHLFLQSFSVNGWPSIALKIRDLPLLSAWAKASISSWLPLSPARWQYGGANSASCNRSSICSLVDLHLCSSKGLYTYYITATSLSEYMFICTPG